MSSESHGDMGLLLISWIFKGEVILLHGSRAQLELLLMVMVIEPTCVFVCVDCLQGPELHIDTVPVSSCALSEMIPLNSILHRNEMNIMTEFMHHNINDGCVVNMIMIEREWRATFPI